MTEISVIVPVYNAEKYLCECIESILAQSYTDYELILVNDGSTDSSEIIIKEYALKDKRIIVINQNNQGPSAARNAGIMAAEGNFITFIDSDDNVDPDYLKVLYYNAINNHAEVCVVSAHFKGNDAAYQKSNSVTVMNRIEAIEHFGFNDGYKFRTPWGKLIKTSIMKKHLFPVDRSIAEDMAVVYKLYYDSNTVIDSTAELYNYNDINEHSLTNKNYSVKQTGTLITYMEIIDFFIENDFPELREKYVKCFFCEAKYQYDIIHSSCENKSTAGLIKKMSSKVFWKNWKKCNLTPYNCPGFDLLFGNRKKSVWKILKKYKSLSNENQ